MVERNFISNCIMYIPILALYFKLVNITEKEIDEIINEAKDKASKQLKERFLEMCE